MEIVIATSNGHKLREFRALFKIFKIKAELISLYHFPHYSPPPETGTTFQENAQLKASHAATELQKWVIADDSGLVVPKLNGAPGVHSRRYAGHNASDAENRKKLLREMSSFTGFERAAYCECCLALCNPEGVTKIFTGICEGLIVTEERGGNGGCYDSLFVKYDYDKTFAQLSEEVKSRISHRYKAFEKLHLSLS